MKYRNIVALIAAVLLSSATAFATARIGSLVVQDPIANPQGDRGVLNLTSDQEAQLKSIRQSEREQIIAIRNDSTLSNEDKEAKIRAIHQSSNQQFFSVLTPAQQQALNSMRERRRGRRGDGDGPDGLGLTGDQQSQLKSIRQNERSQIEAVKNESLTPGERETKIRSIRQSSQQQLSGILTPEQKQKLSERRGRFGGFGGPGGPFGGRRPGCRPSRF